ncbi:head GIN domain-containing protein [Chitinophaga sp. 22536]|uniref:head GIN domain-containing protein n=1 Tax=unclassified Chitinophaga TaxID=2619133 RepID=UPI003F827087
MQTKITLCCMTVALSIAGLFSACIGQNRVKGSGNVIKEERDAPSFHKIKVEGSMNVFLSQGAAKKAVIEAEDNIAPLVELVNEDSRLKVRFRHDANVFTRKGVNVYLTTPEVDEIALSGSGDIKLVDKFNSKDEMKLTLSGSGNLNGTINAPEVKASIAGSGNMNLQGETKAVRVSVAGSGDYVGDNLLSEDAEVKIAGSGDAAVHASVKLEAKIVGSGDVKYKGNPNVSSSVAGSGSVRKI